MRLHDDVVTDDLIDEGEDSRNWDWNYEGIDMDILTPEVGRIQRVNGLAGQFGYLVDVKYGEDTTQAMFVGNEYGGSVFMVTGTFGQSLVDNPERFGDKLSPEWVRRFYA